MVTSVLSVDPFVCYPQHPTSETFVIAWQRYTTLGGQINHNFKSTGRETALFHCDHTVAVVVGGAKLIFGCFSRTYN